MIKEISKLKNADILSVACSFCNKVFKRKVRDIRASIRRRGSDANKMYCSAICSNKVKNRSIITECKQCGKNISLWLCQINSKYRKSQNAFCSTKCAATYNNKQRYINYIPKVKDKKIKHINYIPKVKDKKIKHKTCYQRICIHCNIEYTTQNKISSYCSGRCRNLNLKLHSFAHKSSGKSRSKIEEYLEQKLTTDYPNLKIKFNDKDTVYYELDIHIPTYNLAFELNGIFHYLPIYGEETLKKTQYKDQQKLLRCKEKNIDLHVINLGNTCFSKERGDIIYKIITDIIKSRSGQSRTV
jgi:hypothetical protein